MSAKLNRRRVLRGMIGGSAVSVALPFLDGFLNGNGTALASGGPLPVRFGTWFWGCGVTPWRWVPEKVGTNYDMPTELAYLKPYKDRINVLSGFDVKLDGIANQPHVTGNFALLTGTTPKELDKHNVPTFDTLIADVIGTDTRFRSLEITATGNAKDTYSRRNAGSINPSEGSPVAFYTRLFGDEFRNPNAADFKPDPRVMTRLSVLSAIKDDRDTLTKQLGAVDRARLDEYFTSLRQMEQQLEMQLKKPPPAEACTMTKQPDDMVPAGYLVDEVIASHKTMSHLLAMALACNQTKVFNMVFSDALSALHKAGTTAYHHGLTHNETADPVLGYQIEATWYVERSMEALAYFLGALNDVREGDGTLLDNMLVFAHSDSSLARMHSILGVPMVIAGKAGGRVKTGLHVKGGGDTITRVGLTMQQVMGVPVNRWGTSSMDTSLPVTDILA
jgi:hypothetical protein